MKTLILILMAANYSWAGFETHGGEYWICENLETKLKSIRLLDYALNESPEIFYPNGTNDTLVPDFKLDLGDDSLDLNQKVMLVISRVKHLDPEAFQRYTQRLSMFFSHVDFVENGVLLQGFPKDERDPNRLFTFGYTIGSETVFCKTVHVARQGDSRDLGRYQIDTSLWESSDVNTRAGLVLHEIIYKDAIDQGLKYSNGTRYLNALISSTLGQVLTKKDYDQARRRAGLK